MKNLRSILLALTVLLLATAAQAQTTNVKASIPFDFVVGDHAYTAGEYTVKSMSQSTSATRIDNADESQKGITLSDACREASPCQRNNPCIPAFGRQLFPLSDLDGGQFPWPPVPCEQDGSPACQEL